MPNASVFYAEDLGISMGEAVKISSFMSFARSQPFCQNPKPWVKDEIIRVYFEPWSQNSLPALTRYCDKAYYDSVENDVFISAYAYGRTDRFKMSYVVSVFGRTSFSGAKTRKAFYEFAEAFYEQKDNWN